MQLFSAISQLLDSDMIPRVEHIGQPASASWPKRFRRWLEDLFGSKYAQLLEREIVQLRLERDRAQCDLKATQERLVEVLATTKGIALRIPTTVTPGTGKQTAPSIPLSTWQQTVAAEQEKIAREEAAEREKEAKEN
jgi:hypothetical protein